MARVRQHRRLWALALLCLSVGMLIGAPLSVGVSVRSTSPPLPLTATNGGTGQTVYAVGDTLYADTTASLATRTAGALGTIYTSGGASTAPSWGAKGTTGNCVQWTSSGLGDTGNVCGGAAGGGIAGYSAAAITFAGTQYFPPVGGGPPSSTETAVDAESPSAGTITNFYAVVNTALPAATTLVFTFRNNTADTAVTCTITAGNTDCRDVTHSFTPAAQDKLAVKVVTTGAVTATNLQFTYQYGTTGSNGTVNSGTIHQLAYYNGTGTAVSGEATAGASGTYVKSNGTDWGTSTGSASGTGSCTGSVVTATNSDAAPTCTTAPTLTAGSGTQTYHVPGVLYWEFTNLGNAADTLYITTSAYSLPAATVSTNGDRLDIELLTVWDATASTKTVQCNIGYTSFDTTSGFTGGVTFASFASSSVSVTGVVKSALIRSAATVMEYYTTHMVGTAWQASGYSSGSVTWANANNVLCSAKSSVGTANIVTIKQLRITWSPR